MEKLVVWLIHRLLIIFVKFDCVIALSQSSKTKCVIKQSVLHLGLGMLELCWTLINFTTIALKDAWTKPLDQYNASWPYCTTFSSFDCILALSRRSLIHYIICIVQMHTSANKISSSNVPQYHENQIIPWLNLAIHNCVPSHSVKAILGFTILQKNTRF